LKTKHLHVSKRVRPNKHNTRKVGKWGIGRERPAKRINVDCIYRHSLLLDGVTRNRHRPIIRGHICFVFMGFWCIFFKTSGRIHILMKVVVLSHSPSCIKKANANHHVSACSKILFFYHNFQRYVQYIIKLKIQTISFGPSSIGWFCASFYGFIFS
jgi:hypothetical protein